MIARARARQGAGGGNPSPALANLPEMLRIHRHPCGPRLYVAGVRVHHGAAGIGAAAALAAIGRPALAAVSLIVAAHDWRDFPFRDSDNHETRSRSSSGTNPPQGGPRR